MSHPKKVLFIGSFLSSRDGTLGPAERLVRYLAKDYQIKASSKRKNKLLRFFDILFAASFGRYDIIHVDVFSGQAMFYAFIATLIANLRNKKIITNFHGGKLPWVYSKKKKIAGNILSRSNKIITPSKFLQKFFMNRGFNVKYIPNFIDPNRFPYKQRKNTREHRILWVRAFSPEYNPLTVIRAVYFLKENYPEVSLTMIGPDKGELATCKKLARGLGISENVHFMGKVPNNQLFTYFHSHALFINTPSYESFGLGVLEAASSGIPVISFNVGEVPMLWQRDKEILLCDQKSPEALAGKISEAFQNPEELELMVKAAKEKADNFTWEKVQKSWKKLLEYEL